MIKSEKIAEEIEKIFQELESIGKPEKRNILQRFFKTGKGQYGEGDMFIGVTVPEIRKLAKANIKMPLEAVEGLMASPWHEMRLCGLLILTEKVEAYRKKTRKNTAEEDPLLNEPEECYRFYLEHTANINNWDLVDLSAPALIGAYLIDKDRRILYRLAESGSLWEQRIAIVSTYAFIKEGDIDDTFSIALKLLSHPHDLIQKAVGWMLREAGKRDKKRLTEFLDIHASSMPRTMLRYSIEKFEIAERKYYLELKQGCKP